LCVRERERTRDREREGEGESGQERDGVRLSDGRHSMHRFVKCKCIVVLD